MDAARALVTAAFYYSCSRAKPPTAHPGQHPGHPLSIVKSLLRFCGHRVSANQCRRKLWLHLLTQMHDSTAEHHHDRVFKDGEIAKRVAVHRDDVRELAGRDGSNLVLPAE